MPDGSLKPVSIRRATAHEPKSKRIIDNFPELPSERRLRKSNPRSNNANETKDEVSEEQQNSATGYTAEDSGTHQDQMVEDRVEADKGTNYKTESPMSASAQTTAAMKEVRIPGLDFQGIPPAVMEHVQSLSPRQTINGLKHVSHAQESHALTKAPETVKTAEASVETKAHSPPKRPINGANKLHKPQISLVDALPVVKSSNPDLVAKRVIELAKAEEARQTKRPQEETEPRPALVNTELVDRMEIEQGTPAETTPTVASVEAAAQAMDVTSTTEVRNGAVENAVVSSAGKHSPEQVHDRAVDELPTAEVSASPSESHIVAHNEVVQETAVQPQHIDPVSVEQPQPSAAPEVPEVAMAVDSKHEEAAVPELIVTPAVPEPVSADVPASSDEKSASERESVREEESASTSKKRKRASSTNEKPEQAAKLEDGTDAPQSAQPKPKKRRFETELSGLFHGQINYDYKIEREFLYSTKRSCVVKKETTTAAPKTPSRPMTSSPQPRARSRKAGATDPVFKTPPVSPIKFELTDAEEEKSTSAKPKPPKAKKVKHSNNTNKDPELNNTNETNNKPVTKETKKTTEKPQQIAVNTVAEETPEVNANAANKAPARPRSKSKTKPKDLAESILAKVSNLTPIKNATKNLPKPKFPSKSKKQSASRSESPSTSCPPSPSKPAPLARNASTAAALLLLAEKELIESSTVQALHSTNALIPDTLHDTEQIALSAVTMTTDMEIIHAVHEQQEARDNNKPAERHVVDISGQVETELERMIDIASDTDGQPVPASSEAVRPATPAAHVDPAQDAEHGK